MLVLNTPLLSMKKMAKYCPQCAFTRKMKHINSKVKYIGKKRSPNHRFDQLKCHCCPHIETSQLICKAKQLSGFYMRATLTLNGLSKK